MEVGMEIPEPKQSSDPPMLVQSAQKFTNSCIFPGGVVEMLAALAVSVGPGT